MLYFKIPNFDLITIAQVFTFPLKFINAGLFTDAQKTLLLTCWVSTYFKMIFTEIWILNDTQNILQSNANIFIHEFLMGKFGLVWVKEMDLSLLFHPDGLWHFPFPGHFKKLSSDCWENCQDICYILLYYSNWQKRKCGNKSYPLLIWKFIKGFLKAKSLDRIPDGK